MAEKRRADASYYRLHTDAVEDLATANEQNTPKYSKEELEKYTTAGKKKRVPVPLKVFLIKAWFYGAVCFFIFWGLGLYVASQLDLCVIGAFVMGLVTDLLINTLLRFGERRNGQSCRHMMVARTGVSGMMLNMLYAFVLMFLVVTVYGVINAVLGAVFSDGTVLLGVGPIGFGVIAACVDTLLIACKHTLGDMLLHARGKAS